MTRFGCALDCNDPHFNGIDGILGLGLPDAALSSIPTPLIFALATDRGGLEGANYINERPLHQRKFAFLSTGSSAELQLGGYDRARFVHGKSSLRAIPIWRMHNADSLGKREERNEKQMGLQCYVGEGGFRELLSERHAAPQLSSGSEPVERGEHNH